MSKHLLMEWNRVFRRIPILPLGPPKSKQSQVSKTWTALLGFCCFDRERLYQGSDDLGRNQTRQQNSFSIRQCQFKAQRYINLVLEPFAVHNFFATQYMWCYCLKNEKYHNQTGHEQILWARRYTANYSLKTVLKSKECLKI